MIIDCEYLHPDQSRNQGGKVQRREFSLQPTTDEVKQPVPGLVGFWGVHRLLEAQFDEHPDLAPRYVEELDSAKG